MGHAVHTEFPLPAANMPTEQDVQLVDPVPPVKVPAAQSVQLAEPDPLANCPTGQGKQFVVAKFQPGR